MHEDQLDVADSTVRALVADQFPHWADLPVSPVASHGTVNLLFRLGDELVARLPMQEGDPEAVCAQVAHEVEAARSLLGRVPVPTPEPVATGRPGAGYPLAWSVYRWLPGATPGGATTEDLGTDLAEFVLAVREVGTGGRTFAGEGRGGRLADHDAYVARGLRSSADLIDTEALAALWSDLRTTDRREPDTTTHGDLMPGNLLVRDGRLAAVLDVGGVGPADPALDLMPAWNLLDASSRQAFRERLGADEAMWDRGRGWAFAQAIGCHAYYRDTNPVMSHTAHRTLTALLEDEAVR
jgi:aminoglycoside phosphotransferase (APT) family kinase protein